MRAHPSLINCLMIVSRLIYYFVLLFYAGYAAMRTLIPPSTIHELATTIIVTAPTPTRFPPHPLLKHVRSTRTVQHPHPPPPPPGSSASGVEGPARTRPVVASKSTTITIAITIFADTFITCLFLPYFRIKYYSLGFCSWHPSSLVEMRGFEPLTSSVQGRRSPTELHPQQATSCWRLAPGD